MATAVTLPEAETPNLKPEASNPQARRPRPRNPKPAPKNRKLPGRDPQDHPGFAFFAGLGLSAQGPALGLGRAWLCLEGFMISEC